MTAPPQDPRAGALGLYLEAAVRLQETDARDREGREVLSGARIALEAAEAALRAVHEDRAACLADLSAAVALGREAGLPDPDPLRLLGDAPPAPAQEPREEPPAEEEEPATEPRPRRRRNSPGLSTWTTYQGVERAWSDTWEIAERAGLERGAASSALYNLHRIGLVERSIAPRTGSSNPRVLFRLADPERLPLDRDALMEVRALDRLGREEEVEDRLQAARLRAAGADGAAAVAADPPPEYRPGETVHVYDPEKHHYRVGTVECVLTRGARRGDVRVRLAGANRSVVAPPEKVKREEEPHR